MIFHLEKKKWAFIFACLSMLVLAFGDNARGPLFADMLEFFKVNNAQGSWTFAIASMASLAGNISSVALLRRMTMSQLLVMSLLFLGVGMFVMGNASQFNIYLLGSVFFGFGMGTVGIAQNLLISENVSPNEQSRAFSFLHSIYGLGSFIAPMLAAQSALATKNWQSGFIVVSVIALITFIFSIVARAKPLFVISHYEVDPQLPKSPLSSLFIIGGVFAFYVVAELLISTRLALYLRTYFQMNLEQSSHYVTYFFIFLLLGRLVFAIKKFKAPLKKQLILSLVLSIMTIGLGLYIHPFFLVLSGLTMAPFYPLSVTYISEIAKDRKRQFITFAISYQTFCVITMHIAVGYLTDYFGLFYAFGVGLISLLLSLLCVLFHPRPY